MIHRRTHKETELTEKQFNIYSQKQIFKNNFRFEKIDTGENVVGLRIDDLIKKHKKESPKSSRKKDDKK